MAASLFGERFLDRRKPAWHDLGIVLDGEEITATEAWEKIGPYHVYKERLVAQPSGVPMTGPMSHAILRDPTEDDPATRVFGTVGEDYQLVTPDELVAIWDERVGRSVETIGSLGYGDVFFVTTQLPSFDVNGDEIEDYLICSLPMNGLKAADVRRAPIRVVCANTLGMSERLAVEQYKVVHNQYAKQRLGNWLQGINDYAIQSAAMIKECFELLANTKVDTSGVDYILKSAYPFPKKPVRNAPQNVMEQRMKWWTENVTMMQTRRDGTRELLEGKGTGLNTRAAKGTAWGTYNAVVECEDYRRGRDDDQISESAMFGERYKHKRQAFVGALTLAKA